ncbi:MAG: cysteine desulfurase family protein [Opitutales bacterium]
MFYFDHNATTPLLPQAKAAWLEAAEQHWLNPSSAYRAAAAAHVRLEEARERLAGMLEVDPKRVVFNSGATEGNNAVFAGLARSLGTDARMAVGATEHPSGVEAARFYFQRRIDWLQPDHRGVIEFDRSFLEGVAAISLMAANNETGVLHPWQDWAAACRERGLPMHCDASQWIGKMPLEGLGTCDYVTGCAHKFGGPKGVGFLLVPEVFAAGLLGGAQESGRRAGTEDLAGIAAMLAALEWAESRRANCSPREKEAFLTGLQAALPGVEVLGAGAATLWNTLQIVMPEFQSPRWIRALEKEGFLVSAGSACATGKGGPSHVLAAMGIDAQKADRVLRISAGWGSSAEDWQALLGALLKCHRGLRQEAASSDSQVISI